MNSTFEIASNHVTIHTPKLPQSADHLPVVYLHVVEGDGTDVWEQCQRLTRKPFVLAAVAPHEWNNDLTPWECDGLFAGDAPFAGQARRQLHLLEAHIIPRVEQTLASPPHARMLAGYSLAGLFATWAAFNGIAFSGIASASGSLWYPDFARYVAEQPFARTPTCAYFSLGSKEARTPSRLLRNVAQGTRDVVEAFRVKGVPTTFETNPGNHFKDPALRMAKGIAWALEHQ